MMKIPMGHKRGSLFLIRAPDQSYWEILIV